jgi:hypothetical protein
MFCSYLMYLQKNEDEGDTTLRTAEQAMVTILADRCRFELQTGHAELGLGIFQAAIEYSLFAPLIQTSENNKRRLFEAFWDSQALRIGEEGALGWALWLEREEEELQRAQAHEAAQEEQAPGIIKLLLSCPTTPGCLEHPILPK